MYFVILILVLLLLMLLHVILVLILTNTTFTTATNALTSPSLSVPLRPSPSLFDLVHSCSTASQSAREQTAKSRLRWSPSAGGVRRVRVGGTFCAAPGTAGLHPLGPQRRRVPRGQHWQYLRIDPATVAPRGEIAPCVVCHYPRARADQNDLHEQCTTGGGRQRRHRHHPATAPTSKVWRFPAPRPPFGSFGFFGFFGCFGFYGFFGCFGPFPFVESSVVGETRF